MVHKDVVIWYGSFHFYAARIGPWRALEGFWPVARFIPVFSKLWLTPACNMLLHTARLVERISMGFTLVEYYRVGQNIASWKIMAVLLRDLSSLPSWMKIVRRRSLMEERAWEVIGSYLFSPVILKVCDFN